MYQQDLLKGPVTFLDVAASFSEEEWKLLHEWQKELYENVMKAIHQALASLGPAVATSVFSLRSKENDNPSVVKKKDSDGKKSVNHPTGSALVQKRTVETSTSDGEHADITSAVFLHIKEEGDTTWMEHEDSGRIQTIDDAPEHDTIPVVSHPTKEEGDMSWMAHQDSSRIESISDPPDDGMKTVKVSVGHSVNCNDKHSASKCSAQEAKAKGVRSFGETSSSVNQMPPKYDLGPREEERGPPWQSVFQHTTYSNVCERIPNPLKSDTLSQCEVVLKTLNITPSDSNLEQSQRSHTCPESEKSFCPNGSPIEHPKTHSEKGHFTSIDPERNFSTESNLLEHQRKGLWNRPYACHLCGKIFSSKAGIIRHQPIHTGERPHPCSVCGKRFRHKDVLSRHLTIHTGEKPYACPSCGKSYSRKGTLVRHQTIHIQREDNFRIVNYSTINQTMNI